MLTWIGTFSNAAGKSHTAIGKLISSLLESCEIILNVGVKRKSVFFKFSLCTEIVRMIAVSERRVTYLVLILFIIINIKNDYIETDAKHMIPLSCLLRIDNSLIYPLSPGVIVF